MVWRQPRQRLAPQQRCNCNRQKTGAWRLRRQVLVQVLRQRRGRGHCLWQRREAFGCRIR